MSRRSRKLAKAARLPPGATSRDLTEEAKNVARGNPLAANGQGVQPKIMAGTGADYMGPNEPIASVIPEDVKGRTLDYPWGYNLQTVTRPYEAIGFAELRAFADAYGLARIVIETRKDQMARLTWSIRPATKVDGTPATSDTDPAIEEITSFFKRPDGRHTWGMWLRMLLEDLFVVDAPTLYCDRTRGGKLLALTQIDGGTIGRLIDDWGETPPPPAPAYRQVLHGLPLYYTEDDLVYMPRNPRAHKIFGFSPIEQIIVTVQTGLLREASTLSYWTAGNMPEALCSVPPEWSSGQIKEMQLWFDEMLEGNLASRRKIKFVPGGVAQGLKPIKEPELWQKFDEWLARIVCYAFSVPPTPFIAQNNRATAESAHDAALQEGLAPLQQYVKTLIEEVIRRYWPKSDGKLEFAWDDDREIDPQVQESVAVGYVTNGIKSINEVRDEMGLAPKKGAEDLLVKTATGYVAIDAPPPEPIPPPGAAPPGAPGAKPKPGTPAAKPEKEAQAAKLAGGFPARKGYWGTPRHSHAPNAGGTGGGE